MNKVKRLAVVLLAMVISVFAFCFVACDEETPTPPPAPEVNISVSVAGDNLTYTGSAITPAVTVKDGETALTLDTDYTLAYEGNVNAGTGKVTVTFKGNYEGEAAVEKTFTIGAKAITPTIADVTDIVYTGMAQTPVLTVKDGETTLVKDTDYTVAYANNVNAGTAKATVTLKGNYSGSAEKSFVIDKASVAKPAEDDTVFTYNGSEQTYEIAADLLYTVSGAEQTAAGTHSVIISLFDKDNYKWADGDSEDLSYDFVINAANAGAATVTATNVLIGEKPAVTVEIDGFDLEETDYTIDYGTNTTVGNATVTVAFAGNFTGSATAAYTVSSIASASEVYVDFNGEIVDRAGTPATITKTGTPDESNYGYVGLTEKTNYLTVNNGAPFGNGDFTISFDLNVSEAAFTSAAAKNANSFELVHSEDDLSLGRACSHSAFQLSLYQGTDNELKDSKNYGFRIAVGANSQAGKFKFACKDEMTFGDWMNITYVVERNKGVKTGNKLSSGQIAEYLAEEIAYAHLYIDGELFQTMELYLPTGSSIGGNTIEILQGHTANTFPVGIDNFYFAKRALSADAVAGIAASNAYENSRTMWKLSGDIAFDFMQDGNVEYTDSIVLTRMDASVVGEAILSANIAPYIGTPVVDGLTTTYPLTIPRAKFADFEGGVDATVTVNGFARKLRVIYTPLAGIFVDTAAVQLWSDEVTASGYTFKVKVSADEAGAVPVNNTYGTTFTMAGSALNATYANGEYTVTIPTAAIASSDVKTVSVDLTEANVEAKTFTVQLDITAEERNAMKASAIAYMDFNGNLLEHVSGQNGRMQVDTAAAGAQYSVREGEDKALAIMTKSSKAAIDNVRLGTGDFTLSFDYKLDEEYWASGVGNNYYELLSSIGINDNYYDTIQISANATTGTRECFRIALGRNNEDFYWTTADQKAAIKADRYQKFTLVVDRAAHYEANKTKTGKHFNVMGNYEADKNGTYKTPEGFDVSLYIDGEYLGTKTLWTNYENFGTGTFNFGGKSTADSADHTLGFDNFIVYNRALTQREARAIGAYITDYEVVPEEKLYVSEVEVADIIAASTVTRTVKVSADRAGTVPVEGATFTGVTAVAGANAGEYNVTMPVETAEYAVTKDDLSGVLKVTKVASLVKSSAEPTHLSSISNTSASPVVQGGKVYSNVDLGYKSFTVSMYTDDFGAVPTGGSGGYILFSTHDVDDPFGITCYVSGNIFRFYLGDGLKGSRNINYKVNGANTNIQEIGSGWHNITVQVDRTNCDLVIKLYFDFQLMGTYDSAHSVGGDFSLGENNKFVFGSSNTESMLERGHKRSCGNAAYTPGVAGELVIPTIVDINDVKAHMEAYLASLPDGKTLNDYPVA